MRPFPAEIFKELRKYFNYRRNGRERKREANFNVYSQKIVKLQQQRMMLRSNRIQLVAFDKLLRLYTPQKGD